MDGTGASPIVLHSSFANEPPSHRRFTFVLGWVPFIFFVGLGVFAATTLALYQPTEWPLVALLAPLLAAGGFACLAIALPDFLLRRTVTLLPQRLEYRDFWKTVRIPLSNILAASSAVKDGMAILPVFSRAGTAIIISHGFREEDKTRLWAVLRDRLVHEGVLVGEGLTETQMYAWARDLDNIPRNRSRKGTEEETEHLRTRILRALILTSAFASGIGFGGWVFLQSLETGLWIWTVSSFALLVVMGLCAVSLAAGSARLLAAGLFTSGLILIFVGGCVVIADLASLDPNIAPTGWVGGFGFVGFGIFVCFMAWALDRTRRPESVTEPTLPRASP